MIWMLLGCCLTDGKWEALIHKAEVVVGDFSHHVAVSVAVTAETHDEDADSND
jgi:hypothetical protein